MIFMVGSRVVFNKKTGRYEPIRQDNSREAARPPYQPGKVGSEIEGGYRRGMQSESAVNDSKEFRKSIPGPRPQAQPEIRRMSSRVDVPLKRESVRNRRRIEDEQDIDIYQARRQKLKDVLMPKKKRKG